MPFLVPRDKGPAVKREAEFCSLDLKACQDNIIRYLKERKDTLAQEEINKVLSVSGDDRCALWAQAEILRRGYKFKESEKILKGILNRCPGDAPSLITLSYIRYNESNFPEAARLLRSVLKQPGLERENKAMAYMLLGSINAKKAQKRGVWNKLAFGTRIKGYFERALELAPDLAEVHLGLGTFCLFAPKIAGGDTDRALHELKTAVELAPDFATANARLAQAFKKKGNLEGFRSYLRKAKELDPGNEAVKEIEDEEPGN